jgi:hypothetical protein
VPLPDVDTMMLTLLRTPLPLQVPGLTVASRLPGDYLQRLPMLRVHCPLPGDVIGPASDTHRWLGVQLDAYAKDRPASYDLAARAIAVLAAAWRNQVPTDQGHIARLRFDSPVQVPTPGADGWSRHLVSLQVVVRPAG